MENNNWIRDCTRPWYALSLLAAKPHPESCVHINNFCWRFCVSYRILNSVTRSFEFLIPRFFDSIEYFGDSYGSLFFIPLDAFSGCHQIKVRICDQEKLAFFTPDGKNKCFVVIPFVAKNSPVFYTTILRVLQDEWIILFNDTKHIIKSDTYLVNVYCNSKTIIDDTLIYSKHIPILLHYFVCVTQVFANYRLSFKMSNFFLFLPRLEYV